MKDGNENYLRFTTHLFILIREIQRENNEKGLKLFYEEISEEYFNDIIIKYFEYLFDNKYVYYNLYCSIIIYHFTFHFYQKIL